MKDLNTRITEILSDAFAEMGVLNLRAVADAVIAELGLLPADTKEPYGCQRCDCSCCYGYEDCHCVTDPCNCGSTKREHGR